MTLEQGRGGPRTSKSSGPTRAAWINDEGVVAVDRDDNEAGIVSRTLAHDGTGVLHRAFMVLLQDDAGQYFLGRRSAHKRLWPGVWADSCAGHPWPGEDVLKAASRRVQEELGCAAELQWRGSFCYTAEYGDGGCERELCHVMVGRPCGEIIPDPAEVVEVRAFSPKQLAADIAERPDDFAPWLVRCLQAISPDALVLGSVRSETVTPAVILLDPPDAPGAN